MSVPDGVVVLVGIDKTLKQLKEFDADAVRRFNSLINKELAGAESEARSYVARAAVSAEGTPMRGWRSHDAARPRRTTRGGAGWPGWNTGDVQKGIRKTRAQGKPSRRKDYTTSAGALLNKSAAGAIFEVAGRHNQGKGNGEGFIEKLNWFGHASRLVWKAVDKDRDRIQAKVSAAFDDAKALLQKHLDRERA